MKKFSRAWAVAKIIFAFVFTLFYACRVPVHAQDTQSLLKKVFTLKSIPPHQAVKVGTYLKQGKKLTQKFNQVFLSGSRFKLHMTEPSSMKDDVFFADGKDITFYIPRHKMKMISPLSKAEFSPTDMFGANVILSKIFQNYKISQTKKETVSGIPCVVLKLESKAEPGMYRLLSIDPKSGLLVKDERFQNGKFYASYALEKVSLKAPGNAELEAKIGFAVGMPGSDSTDYKSLDAAKSSVPFGVLVPKFVPKGFFIEKVKVRKSLLGKEVVLFYTDGLTRFDITQRKSGLLNAIANKVLTIVEDFYVYSPVIKLEDDRDELQVILAGELPESTLKKILSSL